MSLGSALFCSKEAKVPGSLQGEEVCYTNHADLWGWSWSTLQTIYFLKHSFSVNISHMLVPVIKGLINGLNERLAEIPLWYQTLCALYLDIL